MKREKINYPFIALVRKKKPKKKIVCYLIKNFIVKELNNF